MEKKLYRDKKNEKLAGVCAGIAKYLKIDMTLVRLIWALASLCSVGTGLLIYIICALIIPEEPEDYVTVE